MISGTRWLRELDLNQRPSGYEPAELPDCSIPRHRLWASETPKGPPSNGSALRLVNGFCFPAARKLQCLAATYSSSAFALVPSALPGFTSEFEMGSGGSQAL